MLMNVPCFLYVSLYTRYKPAVSLLAASAGFILWFLLTLNMAAIYPSQKPSSLLSALHYNPQNHMLH
jgi:hypothetical protein